MHGVRWNGGRTGEGKNEGVIKDVVDARLFRWVRDGVVFAS